MSSKVFVSHSVKDKNIVKDFVDIILHGALSVPIKEIFCISADGTKIKSGDDWRDSIKQNILSAKINILIITPNYKESEVCLNEMGAAWMTDAKVLPLIIEPINYKTVGVIEEPKQIEKLLDDESLDNIRDVIKKELGIDDEDIPTSRWTAKKSEFILKAKAHLASASFETPMDRNAFKQLLKDKEDFKKTVDDLVKEKTELEQLVEELKKAKDKTAVSAILKKNKKTTKFEEFIELCNHVKVLLDRQSPIINGIIYKSYTGKDIKIGVDVNRVELDEALANGFIDEDLDVIWDTTKTMKNISSALSKVSVFLKSKLDEGFFEDYEDAFDAPMDLKNKMFWEDVFDVQINFQ